MSSNGSCSLFQLIAYFAERMISEKTLQRNSVMQLSSQKVP